MRKVAIVSQNLKVGGIQRSLINILQNIDYNKYQIDCYLYEKENFYKDSLPKNVKIKFLESRCKFVKLLPFNLVKRFSKSQIVADKYDVIIDFDGYQTDVALDVILSNCSQKVCWIHNNFLLKSKYEFKYRLLNIFMRKKYQSYNHFVGVSKGVIKPFEQLNKIEITDKSIVVPNYINTDIIRSQMNESCSLVVDNNKYNFVSMGRLSTAKGFDLLFDYLNSLKDIRTDFHFYLIGTGPKKEELLKQIACLGLEQYVTLLGNQANPFKYMKMMDGFILTSRYEGQGMVLLEAKALGLELFTTKNLEVYNENIPGYDDLVAALAKAEKKEKHFDSLEDYNMNITKCLDDVLNEDSK